ncbi:MAG: SRPBCC family protein [Syntrophobacteraceae bacterium]
MPSRRFVAAEIEIDAPCAVVWRVLTDFSGYCSWNPTIKRIDGRPAVNACLKVFACLPCGLPMMLRPKLLEYRPEREIIWLGIALIPGILDGNHLFKLEPINEIKTRFVQREEYSGILLPFLWKWLGEQGRRAFEIMNAALKVEAERIMLQTDRECTETDNRANDESF